MPTFGPIPFNAFINAVSPVDTYGGTGSQVGQTIGGLDGKHYSITWTFDGPVVVRVEDGVQTTITSARFVADQQANGLPGIGFFVPAYGCVGVPNTPYFYVWAQDGNFLFGQPCHICFLRYTVQADGSFTPSGGSMFVFDSTGGNRHFALNPSGGNGAIFGANVVNGFLYIASTISAGNGDPPAGNCCLTAIPFVSTFSSQNLDWVAHNIDMQSTIGTTFFNTDSRESLDPQAWLIDILACIVDNGDTTGSIIQYAGRHDIAVSPNPYISGLSQAQFVAVDFKFTPAALPGTGGTWSISAPYNESVSGITFPFSDANKQRDGSAGSDADDYYSPSPLSIGGGTYLAVPRAYGEQANWPPQGIGVKYILFSYAKGAMTYVGSGGTYEDVPYDPVTNLGYGGNVNLSITTAEQAFIGGATGNEIWGFHQYEGSQNYFVWWKLFSISFPPPPSEATSYTRVWGAV